MSPPTVVGIGEVLWDLLPTGRQLGGAPANFAYCAQLLGNGGVVASRVGNDVLGDEVKVTLQKAGIECEFLQTDFAHATGAVNVNLDSSGQPAFEIACPAAWDFLEWNQSLERLANASDAVCFGSLAQRSPESRHTILKFLGSTPKRILRIFDVNLRQSFYSAEIVADSMKHANAIKLNHEELAAVARVLDLPSNDEKSFCRYALEKFDLQLICVTRGQNGSLLVDRAGAHEHPGFHVRVRDTVGAGDAFTAGLASEFLRGGTRAEMSDLANRMGAWVASCAGAMPPLPEGGLKNALAKLQSR